MTEKKVEITCSRCKRNLDAKDQNELSSRIREERWVIIPNGDDPVVYCSKCAKRIL